MSTLDEAKLLQNRTKTFAVRIIKAFARLPKDEAVRVIGRQFFRSGNSPLLIMELPVGRAPLLNFISKTAKNIVVEETDETLFWFELLVEAELIEKNLVEPLMKECQELLKIFSASLATAKQNR